MTTAPKSTVLDKLAREVLRKLRLVSGWNAIVHRTNARIVTAHDMWQAADGTCCAGRRGGGERGPRDHMQRGLQ